MGTWIGLLEDNNMEEPIQRVKAYPLFQSKSSKLCKGKATNGQDFLSTLRRSAKLLQNVAMGKGGELDDGGGESSLDDASDDGDEIRNFEVKDVTSGSFGKGKVLHGYKRCKDLSLMCISKGKLDAEQMLYAQGIFQRALLYPWWELDVRLKDQKKGPKAKYLQGPPKAQLRNDPGVDDTIVFLFLYECGVDAHHLGLLKDLARNHNTNVSFANLENILDMMNNNELQGVHNSIDVALENSEEGPGHNLVFLVSNFYKKARKTSSLQKILEALLSSIPKGYCKHYCKSTPGMYAAIRCHVHDSPWELGYLVKTKQKFGLHGVEVKLKGFIDSGLLHRMPKLMQDALYVYNGMKKVTANEGHTYVTMRQITCKSLYSAKKAVLKRNMDDNDIIEAISYLIKENILERDILMSGEEVLVFPHIKGYEVYIAKSLQQLMSGSPCLPISALNGLDFGGDADQMKAAQMMTEKPVVVLSGPGGCGKTYVVSKLLSQVVVKCPLHSVEKSSSAKKRGEEANNDRISSACALASLLDDSTVKKEICCADADNSHSEQAQGKPELTQGGIKLEKQGLPEETTEKTLTHDDVRSKDQLLDDECLITAPTGRAAVIIGKRAGVMAYTMHQVIYSYVNHCRMSEESAEGKQNWRFHETRLLICDECSLISVRLFSMLVGILRVHAKLSQIVLLGDINQLPSIEPGNLLADVFSTLRRHGAAIRLQTNHRAESELIVANAKRISRQIMPVFEESKGFVPLCIDHERDIGIKVNDLLHTQESLLKDIGSKNGDEKSQFIAFRRKDCDLINELCCKHYNKHSIRDSKNRRDFQINDKICATKNREVRDMEHNQMVKITNGEIFFLRDDRIVEDRGEKHRHWVIDDLERQLKIDFKDIRKLKMKHAYARTIHTYQGSESDVIIYVVGKPWYQTCQHVYTAITRGKRQAVVLFDESSLGRAVMTPPKVRNTRLAFHLTEKLQDFGLGKPDTEDYGLLEDDDFFLENNTIEPESFFSNDADDDFFMNIDDEILSSSQPNCNKLESEDIGFSAASKTPLSSRRKKDSKKPKTKPMKMCRNDGVYSNEKDLEEDSSDQFYTAPESPNPKGPSGTKGKSLRNRSMVNCKRNSKVGRPDSSDSDVLFSDSDECNFSSNHSSELSQNAPKRNQRRKRQRDQ
eukprot:gene463-10138_t